MGELESFTAYEVDNGNFKRLSQIDIPNSIGILYSLVTKHLGFKFNADEYKLMGLAPYGDPTSFRKYFDEFVILGELGKYKIKYDKLTCSEQLDPLFRDVLTSFAKAISTPPDVDEMEQTHYDFAAAAQECLEQALLHALRHWRQETGLKKLSMAGGVALNCTLNGKIINENLFDDFYIQPAAGDDGTSLGARPICGEKKWWKYRGQSSPRDAILWSQFDP